MLSKSEAAVLRQIVDCSACILACTDNSRLWQAAVQLEAQGVIQIQAHPNPERLDLKIATFPPVKARIALRDFTPR